MGIVDLRTPCATLVCPNGYTVGELMATRSGRFLIGAFDRIVYSSAHVAPTLMPCAIQVR